MSEMKIKIGKTELKNPVIGASGCSGWGFELLKYNSPLKIGGFVTKSVTKDRKTGNDSPRLHETASGMLNSIGLENGGVEYFAKEIQPLYKGLECAVFVNAAPFEKDDIRAIIETLEPGGNIDGYEVNISCPNVSKGGISFNSDRHNASSIIKGLRKLTERTLILKLSPYFSESFEIAKEAEDEGFDAISFTNTFVGTAVDIEKRKFVFKNRQAGLSGPAIKPLAQWAVFRMAGSVSIPVIGIGGISCTEDVVEYMMLGASAVQIGTGVLTSPSVLEESAEGLKDYCIRNRINSIKDIIGIIK